jgi:inosose dehydratase
MSKRISRRSFVASLAAFSVFGARMPRLTRKLKVGYTGVTWGYVPSTAEAAIHDVGSLGFHAFETFAAVLEWWETRGGLGQLLERAGLPLRSAYCPFDLTSVTTRRDEVAKARRWGALIKKYGGSIAVIGPNPVARETFAFSESRSTILAALGDIGLALEDVGVAGAIHPHIGSCIQSRDEIFRVMDGIDARRLGLGPDLGELLASGADPLAIVKELASAIRHVHLTDFDGGTKRDGYCPLGQGQVDIAAIVDVLETSHRLPMLMVELNPPLETARAPRTPLEAARAAKTYMESLGYAFRA